MKPAIKEKRGDDDEQICKSLGAKRRLAKEVAIEPG